MSILPSAHDPTFTNPPALLILSSSSGAFGLWSSLNPHAVPLHDKTQRESPTLATKSFPVGVIRVCTAVHPTNRAGPRSMGSTIVVGVGIECFRAGHWGRGGAGPPCASIMSLSLSLIMEDGCPPLVLVRLSSTPTKPPPEERGERGSASDPADAESMSASAGSEALLAAAPGMAGSGGLVPRSVLLVVVDPVSDGGPPENAPATSCDADLPGVGPGVVAPLLELLGDPGRKLGSGERSLSRRLGRARPDVVARGECTIGSRGGDGEPPPSGEGEEGDRLPLDGPLDGEGQPTTWEVTFEEPPHPETLHMITIAGKLLQVLQHYSYMSVLTEQVVTAVFVVMM